jgi:DNA (cytosine-5)-methyltransferase 1
MTVTLSNYDITISGKNEGRWMTSVQYGNGKGFPCDSYPDGFYANLENVIEQFEYGKDFIGFINNGFSEKIAKGKTLQEMYESRCGRNEFVEPTELVERVAQIINQYDFKEPNYTQDQYRVFTKSVIPKKQVMALYAINRICSIANG